MSESCRTARSRRSLLSSAEWDGERAKNDRKCQRPEAELDFQGGPAGATGEEPEYAGESHACAASGCGEFVGVYPATNERRQIDGQLSDITRHHRCGWRDFESNPPKHVLRRHR